MKNVALVILLMFGISFHTHAQKGLFAGNQKKMIGQKYSCGKLDNLLKGWKYTGGFALTNNDGSGIDQTITTYQKATTILVLFTTNVENSPDCTIEDVLEITNVATHTNLQTATCTVNGESHVDLLALEKGGKILKAWRADRDRLHFAKAGTKGVNCAAEGL
jgi:hypothetical protein